MTKKDFIMVANIIRRIQLDPVNKRRVIWTFAQTLKEFYPTFNSSKFIQLCDTPWESIND
jgi:hypothetical protein